MEEDTPEWVMMDPDDYEALVYDVQFFAASTALLEELLKSNGIEYELSVETVLAYAKRMEETHE